jgi:hypothetical protein
MPDPVKPTDAVSFHWTSRTGIMGWFCRMHTLLNLVAPFLSIEVWWIVPSGIMGGRNVGLFPVAPTDAISFHLPRHAHWRHLFPFQCKHMPGYGFHRGNYRCYCKGGFYFPPDPDGVDYFNGTALEDEYISHNEENLAGNSNDQSQCLPCARGCRVCTNNTPCFVEYDVMLRGIPLGIQSFCMTITLVLGFILIRLRRNRVSIIPSGFDLFFKNWEHLCPDRGTAGGSRPCFQWRVLKSLLPTTTTTTTVIPAPFLCNPELSV